jgi:hypothetical protein
MGRMEKIAQGALQFVLFRKYYYNDRIKMRFAGNVARMGEMRNAYKVLVKILEEKMPLGRPTS